MKRPDDGGAAFPRSGYYPEMASAGRDHDAILERLPTVTEPRQGMSLRDYFAAAAVRGCAAAVTTDRLLKALGNREAVAEAVALAGYLIADALLARRKEHQ